MPAQCIQEEGAEEDLTPTLCLFWEPLFCTALWSFPDSSWNKYSDLVSPGSNVVYMLWGLLVMQRTINRDCQEAFLKEHPSFTGIAGDMMGPNPVLVAKLHVSIVWLFLQGNYGNLKQCRQSNHFICFMWPVRFVFLFSCSLTYLWSHKLHLLSAMFS